MGRRSGFGGLLGYMEKAAAQQQREYNAQIRLQQRQLRQEEANRKAYEREIAKQNKDEAIQFGIDQSNRAEKERNQLVSLLKNAPHTAISVDFDSLKRKDKFKIPKPEAPEKEPYPPEIDISMLTPKLGLLDKLVKRKAEEKNSVALQNYEQAVADRDMKIKAIDDKNLTSDQNYKIALDTWQDEKNRFLSDQSEFNQSIDRLKNEYASRDKNAIEFFFNQIVSQQDIPVIVASEWSLEYNPENGILIIDMILPSKEVIPNLKSKKYVVTRQEYTDTFLKEKEIDAIYDEMILQLCLRVVHDVAISDIDALVDMIVFNGVHNGMNRSTGKEESKYILSLNVKREEFLDIDIRHVDARSCFVSLRGISGAKLADLVPIAPTITMTREDKRFVAGVDVAHTIEGQNLASMDWENFEHLIRELFEKEFAVNGAEVRITQASRDGGVDAVMFDPDPIRGGKFIIQAKRYTNVVGVSAVRDLYGTLSHEGAVKGILVTTANFGADSYEFAKNKPLTLISGSNLLFLLQKHGYNARIDIEEAKKLLKSE